jgi:catechol 2,3-dioxygenase-like lactoylglutathione lyase family enzyme
MKLHHLALGASDVAALAAFYKDVFSLPELDRFRYQDDRLRSIWLDMNGTILMVEHTDEAPRHVRGVGSGPFLLAFQIEPSEHDGFVSALAERNIDVEEETEYTTYFRDPEGNRVAVSSYPFESDSAST